MEAKIYKIKEINWTELAQVTGIQIPLQVTVPVIDLNDPEAVHQDITVTIVTTLMMRTFLAMHLHWDFIAPVIGQGDTATLRFADMWIDFVSHRMHEITRSARAYAMEYNPALTYFKHEYGDSDKIEYGRTNVTNSGGLTESTTRAGKTATPSIASPDTDDYRAVTVNTSMADGVDPSTTTQVTTYDSTTPETTNIMTNTGDTASLSGSTQSAKSTDSGEDTHSRDLYMDGSDALHTTIDMIKQEIEMRMHLEIGNMLLTVFADEFLFLGGGD